LKKEGGIFEFWLKWKERKGKRKREYAALQTLKICPLIIPIEAGYLIHRSR